MTPYQKLTYTYIGFVFLTTVGALLKIAHWGGGHFILTLGLLSLLVFAVLAIIEITGSKKIEGTEKFMWIIGLLFLSVIAGFVYLVYARKRIV